MSATWLSIRVELVEGRGEMFWPRPGRLFAAARRHTFADLADAIDDAFSRWDRAHLHMFDLADGTVVGHPLLDLDLDEETLEDRATKLSRLQPGEQFAYEFDLGDGWTHLCTVGDRRVDPMEVLSLEPDWPMPYWGWGSLPDQYGRRWETDDGESALPPDPGGVDLPPLRPHWGPRP